MDVSEKNWPGGDSSPSPSKSAGSRSSSHAKVMTGDCEVAAFAEFNGMTQKQYARRGWLVLVAMLFAGIVAVMNQFQVPVFMNVMIDDFFPKSPGDAGWLMSVIAIAAVVIAFPSAYLLNRFGAKRIGVCGLALMFVGACIGAASTVAGMMIFGRVLQGAGVAVMGIVATTIISMYFPRSRAGRPMGIWNLWYVVGATLAYTIAIPVASALGGSETAWHAWWWFCAVAAGCALVVFAVFVKVPKIPPASHLHHLYEVDEDPRAAVVALMMHETHAKVSKAKGAADQPRALSVLLAGFKEPRMWLLGLTFGCLMFTSLCVLSWVPTYVQDVEAAKLVASGAGYAAAEQTADAMSGSFAALGFASSIPMSFITAFLLGRFTFIRARKVMLVIASLLGFLYAFAFVIPLDWLAWWLVLLGIESGWTSGVVLSLVPQTMKHPQTVSVGFACVIFFQGISNLLATPVVGYVIGSADEWAHVAPLCVISACVGALCCVIYALTGFNSSKPTKNGENSEFPP